MTRYTNDRYRKDRWLVAIISFSCSGAEDLFCNGSNGKKVRKYGWAGVAAIAYRKLDMLNAAVNLNDLRTPPNNRLEALKGDRLGQHSIRVNDQWRICFKWDIQKGGANDVEIADYH